MFRKNDQHRQIPMFSSIDSLPEKQRKRLEESWAGTFYRQVFTRIDEEIFAEVYSEESSRPNIPVNVLVGLEILKPGFGWNDEEMYDAFCFDVQVRYALGYYDLSEGHFDLRTVYNFRDRITQHMQATGENLFEKAFEQIADEQSAAFQLKRDKLRMDSSLIASNIRAMSRLQLLVEVLQRVHRMLGEADQQHYGDDFAPYIKGSSGQYIYRIKGEQTNEHLQRIGELMHKLIDELSNTYAAEQTYQMLQRVFQEHFTVTETVPRPKAGAELSASSLQAPDDWEATYREKGGRGHKGYVINLTETCHPENEFQLIVKVQTESNNIDDAAMLVEALPSLKERTAVEQLNTDGGYNGPNVDEIMREQRVAQIQTAIRGRKPATEKLGLDDFDWETNTDMQPQTVTCPQGQQVAVTPGRAEQRYRAAFEALVCENCPFFDQCPTHPLKRTPECVLRFSQPDLDLALRRQRSAEARASGQNLRAAVEATVRAVKCRFRNGKLPVRGKPRVSMMMIGSAAMNNVRQIHRYLVDQKRPSKEEKLVQKRVNSAHLQPVVSFFVSLWTQSSVRLRSLNLFQLALSFGF